MSLSASKDHAGLLQPQRAQIRILSKGCDLALQSPMVYLVLHDFKWVELQTNLPLPVCTTSLPVDLISILLVNSFCWCPQAFAYLPKFLLTLQYETSLGHQALYEIVS